MAGVIQNLEILSAGRHQASTGDVSISEQDLDMIIENFTTLQGSNVVKPHLKLGHTDAQKWFGQENGIPTLGWITKVWRVGKKMLANVEGVPDALLAMIRAGRYHNVSSEIYLSPIEVAGKKVSHILSAVAILGTEMPAAKDLAGLAQALFASSFEDQTDADPVLFTQEKTMPDNLPGLFTQAQVDALIESAAAKAVAAFKAANTTEVTELTTKLTVAEKRATDAEALVTKLQGDAANAEAMSLIEAAIKEGRLLPKQKDLALAFMTGANGVVKFGDGEKSLKVLFKEFLGAAGKQVDLSEKGSGANGERTEFPTAAAEVDYKAKKLLSADTTGKLTYSGAFDKVLAADETLKGRYINGEAA
jgi:hypothetical protein